MPDIFLKKLSGEEKQESVSNVWFGFDPPDRIATKVHSINQSTVFVPYVTLGSNQAKRDFYQQVRSN